MISGVGYDTQPSFKGIVKVKGVFIDGKLTNSFKDVKAATARIVDVLTKKSDTPETKLMADYFRKLYKFFDKDYQTPLGYSNSSRNTLAKAEVGNSFYLVSGNHAAELAYRGENYGKKKALVKISQEAAARVVDQIAKENYSSTISEIAAQFIQRPSHPTVVIYATKDKKGIVRLLGARMENDTNNLKYRPTQYNSSVKLSPFKPAVKETKPQKTQQKNVPKENNTFRQEPSLDFSIKKHGDLGLEGKTWDIYEKPKQLDFFDKLK